MTRFLPRFGRRRQRTARQSLNRRPTVDRLEDRLAPALGFGSAFSFGGNGTDIDFMMSGFAVGSDGATYVAGAFLGTINVDPSGTFNLTSTGSWSSFVAKYSADGALVWAEGLFGT